MFLDKTNTFYRNFLDKLYAVADLLTDRPEPKPPDPENIPSPTVMVGLVSLGFSMSGKPTWTTRSGSLNTSSSAREEKFGFFLSSSFYYEILQC